MLSKPSNRTKCFLRYVVTSSHIIILFTSKGIQVFVLQNRDQYSQIIFGYEKLPKEFSNIHIAKVF